MKRALSFAFLHLLLLNTVHAADTGAGAGYFFREHWYQPGATNGNPDYEINKRFRVNAPEAVLHPTFGSRREVRASGMMTVYAEEDLRLLTGAELYLELWGGHPHSANKRVTINGRNTYSIPEIGTASGHCTHQYPIIPLKLNELVNGYNALQFAVDQGKSFWGHFIVEQAAIKATLTNNHPALNPAGLADFSARVEAATDGELTTLKLVSNGAARIASVEFHGHYHGYDENGDGRMDDWHGFTKARAPVAIIGSATNAPFQTAWDMTMLPAQSDMQVRAVVRFREPSGLSYVTPPTRGLRTPERPQARVALYSARNIPPQFWSRAGRKVMTDIHVEDDPADIISAELHVVVWDGGAGKVKEYFTLNDHPFPVAGGGKHDTIYSRLRVDPKILKRGANQIVVHSDTEHHGIEVLLPGPALVVRSRR
ncbi:MAG: hypothetical protein AB1705_13970 [Verrucomicrobiota bacterium]